VLIIASGATDRRSSSRAQPINEAKLRDLLGLEIGRAAAAFVRNTIGFTIGGVPTAAGHATKPIVVIDRDLRQFASVWAAGGTPMRCSGLPPMSS
jgi:prolyl-tRNA editing enzyme YbaK/EbsC (Cys-tRNA(Pro) deacylase)